jgi:hypothetical protein
MSLILTLYNLFQEGEDKPIKFIWSVFSTPLDRLKPSSYVQVTFVGRSLPFIIKVRLLIS